MLACSPPRLCSWQSDDVADSSLDTTPNHWIKGIRLKVKEETLTISLELANLGAIPQLRNCIESIELMTSF
jgi:hypothetical protein